MTMMYDYDRLLAFGLDMAATAVHESGHAAGARLYGFNPDAVTIRADQAPSFGERCKGYCQTRLPGSSSPIDLWRNAVIIAMGPVAEFKFLGEVEPGGHMREVVEELLNFSKHGGFDSFDSDSQKLANYAQKIYGALEPEETLIKFAHGATREAARLLDANWPAVIRLAESFIRMTELMDEIVVEPRVDAEQERHVYEHLREYQAKVSERTENSGGETGGQVCRVSAAD